MKNFASLWVKFNLFSMHLLNKLDKTKLYMKKTNNIYLKNKLINKFKKTKKKKPNNELKKKDLRSGEW